MRDTASIEPRRWATSERSLDAFGEPLMRSKGDGHEAVVIAVGEGTALISLSNSFVYATVSAHTAQVADAELAKARELLPAPEATADQDVPVMFWTYSPQGPMPSVRKISVPEWSEISDNYTEQVRESLDGLMTSFRPAHGGQLILWHGEVGTGKTFALRALAWEWRDWCQLHYIVDPDTFFGEHADYLMSVLTQSGGLGAHVGMMMATHPGMMARSFAYNVNFDEASEEEGFAIASSYDDNEDGEDGARRRAPQWRLLVLEDTGELLRPDAKSIIGQGLSRFLNVVDGLIGQGLRVLVLVTTNEEVGALHPAVARPGRSAANIEFSALTKDEAEAWLKRHRAESPVPSTRTLASLYAVLEGRDPADLRPVGFGE